MRDAREDGVSRDEILLRLSRIPGVYVPSLYEIVADESSTRWGYAVPRKGTGAPEVILKRCIPDLSATEPVPQRIVPYLGIVQDREAVEVLRGCARGCRFCQAGMVIQTDWGNDEAVAFLQHRFDRIGLDDRLAKAGCVQGDEVRILGYAFSYVGEGAEDEYSEVSDAGDEVVGEFDGSGE